MNMLPKLYSFPLQVLTNIDRLPSNNEHKKHPYGRFIEIFELLKIQVIKLFILVYGKIRAKRIVKPDDPGYSESRPSQC